MSTIVLLFLIFESFVDCQHFNTISYRSDSVSDHSFNVNEGSSPPSHGFNPRSTAGGGGRVPWIAFNNTSSSETVRTSSSPLNPNEEGLREGRGFTSVRFPGPIETVDGGFFAPPQPSLVREFPRNNNNHNRNVNFRGGPTPLNRNTNINSNNFEVRRRGVPVDSANENNFGPNIHSFSGNNNNNNFNERRVEPSRFENFNNNHRLPPPVNVRFSEGSSRGFRSESSSSGHAFGPPSDSRNGVNFNSQPVNQPSLPHEPGRQGRRFIPNEESAVTARPTFVNNNNNVNRGEGVPDPSGGGGRVRNNVPLPVPALPVAHDASARPALIPTSSSPSSPAGNGIVPASCLPCLCSASSGCDLKKKCEGDFCGPYLISWNYWSDGGSPGGDFISCTLNRECAEEAIQGYMKKWARDCNGDGVVDCDDFAAIHKLGPHQCRSDDVTRTNYWREYERCEARVRLGGGSLGSSSTAVTDLRRPERGFSPPNETPNAIDSFHSNVGNTGQPSNHLPRIPGFNRNDVDASGFPHVAPPLFFQPPVTPRPTLDLPLITPRRRLFPPSLESREGTSGEIRNNSVEEPEKPPLIPMSNECMECICDAASGCNLETRCSGHPLDETGRVCGPYQMDTNYWRLGGKIGGEFEKCANEKECAEQTVSRFVRRMAYDCNEDGVVDCLDYAAIHRGGPKSCNTQWLLESKFWNAFEQCYGFSRRR